jgi:transcription antitermination factor NusG
MWRLHASMNKKNSDLKFEVGDRVRFVVGSGAIADGTVRAIIQTTGGVELNVSFGKDLSASVNVRQVVQMPPLN